MRASEFLRSLPQRSGHPVDNSILVYFRILFGIIMAIAYESHLGNYEGLDISPLEAFITQPLIHFKYYGFGWVEPLPGELMIWFTRSLQILSLTMAAGMFYRPVTWLLCLGNAYYFFCERTQYNNHYYLTALILFWMAIIPAHRAFSVDSILFPEIRTSTAPAWTVWMLRFHIALPYVFGGIMKLQGDWLHGEPCRLVAMRLIEDDAAWGLFRLFDVSTTTMFLTWGGIIFDMLVVPGLLISKPKWIRWFTCFCIAAFHLQNHFIFSIGIFPWLMLLSTPVFFSPSGPRRVLNYLLRRKSLSEPESGSRNSSDPPGRFLLAGIACYILFQALFPFRICLYPGPVNWTEEAEHFSWQMMKREKRTIIQFFAAPYEGGRLTPIPLTSLKLQHMPAWRMSSNFDMILQTAHRFADMFEEQGLPRPIIKAFSLVSMNGRRPQILFDPNLDLARIPRKLGHHSEIRPLESPVPDEPYLVPTSDWPKHFPLKIEGSVIIPPEMHPPEQATVKN